MRLGNKQKRADRPYAKNTFRSNTRLCSSSIVECDAVNRSATYFFIVCDILLAILNC